MSIFSWLRRRFHPDDNDVEEEIRAHLAIDAAERMADGTGPEDARYAALREFGNVTLATEDTRRVWTPRWLEILRDQMSDVRYAIRALAKTPTFSLAVIGVLILGIGLNAAVFTMLKSMVLSPIAGVEGSASLTVIHGETNTGRKVRLSYPDYQFLRDHDRAFSGLFGTIVATINLGRGRAARQIWGELVTGNYFDVLGVRARLGRTLSTSDEIAPGRHPVVVISDGLWRRDFGADRDIIGKTIEINTHLFTVVGVADPTFHGTTVVYDVEAYIPVMMAPQLGFTFGSEQTTPSAILSDRRAGVFFPTGYLRPDGTRANARAQIDALWGALSLERRLTDGLDRLRVVPFWQQPGGAPTYMLPTLVVLSAMGSLVLMIACANVAGLVLVRGVSRRGELAMRLALGATRARVVRLLIVENLVLAVPGALLGILLAQNGLPVLVSYAEWLAAPQRVFFNIEPDGFVIGFVVLAGFGSALAFGLLPAIQSSRLDLVSVINEDASPRGAPRGRLRTGLVVAQVAVSLMLLVGAGLVTRSLGAASTADPGFDAALVASVALDVKQNGYDEPRGRIFYRKLLDSARADAGIESAALAAHAPLSFLGTRVQRVTIEDYDTRPDEDLVFMSNTVSADYFRTLRIPIVEGRPFEDRDDEVALPVVMVNRTFANRFWGGTARAIGKRIRIGRGDWRTVIGVASDVKYSQINESPRPYFYLPFPQAYRSAMTLHTRASRLPATSAAVDPRETRIAELVARSRAHVSMLDRELPIVSARPLAEQISGALIFMTLAATMLLVFGIAGMALTAIGTYGLVSYTVRQRSHEIGVRMALGATACSVVGQFLAHGLRLGAIGAAIGIVAALGASRLLDSMLFGVSTTDHVSFVSALTAILGCVAIATVLPAWRAAKTDPLSALRHQ